SSDGSFVAPVPFAIKTTLSIRASLAMVLAGLLAASGPAAAVSGPASSGSAATVAAAADVNARLAANGAGNAGNADDGKPGSKAAGNDKATPKQAVDKGTARSSDGGKSTAKPAAAEHAGAKSSANKKSADHAADKSAANSSTDEKPSGKSAGNDKGSVKSSASDKAAKADGGKAGDKSSDKGSDKSSDNKSSVKGSDKNKSPSSDKSAAKSGPASEWCKQISARLGSVSLDACQHARLVPSGAFSVNKFPILVRRVTPGSGKGKGKDKSREMPVRILLLGGIHGDELTASSIVFRWMQGLSKGDARDFQWTIAPVLNPDGMLQAKPVRMNANGVDLNRNFPTPQWTREAPKYWSKVTRNDPRRFPGKAPLSEPETRWVNAEIERMRPNVIISVHAPFGLLDFDGPAPVPDRFGRLMFNNIGVYPGSLGNFSGRQQNVPVITIELPNAGSMPPDDEVERIWTDMLTWIKRNVPPSKLAGKVGPLSQSKVGATSLE
ncbi:MAG: M14 family zinc carboxypeptidase, partial [Janthinobacterium lividum]